MFQTKFEEENKTYSLCSVTVSGIHGVYKIMWKNFVEPDRQQMTI